MPDVVFQLIYLTNGKLILSKKHYNSWHEIQDEYENYMTNLSFMTCEDIINFFKDDFGEEYNFPFSKNEILNFAKSDDIIIST